MVVKQTNCSAWPRLKLNTKIGFHTTTHHPPTTPPPTTQTLRQQYLSCYWPDLDQTLNKGSWEHIQQITTVTTTFVQTTFVLRTFVLRTFVHISNNSAVTSTYILECGTPSSACFPFLPIFLHSHFSLWAYKEKQNTIKLHKNI